MTLSSSVEDDTRAVWEKWSNDGTELQVAKLMEENVGATMQLLHSKALCIMPISLAMAIYHLRHIFNRQTGDESSTIEYNEFYRKTFSEYLDPLSSSHFTTEGEVEFRSIFFVPHVSPMGKDAVVNQKIENIRVYVKRVFIYFDGELFPRYLSFIKGVVDLHDLPLNVSHEILQESRNAAYKSNLNDEEAMRAKNPFCCFFIYMYDISKTEIYVYYIIEFSKTNKIL